MAKMADRATTMIPIRTALRLISISLVQALRPRIFKGFGKLTYTSDIILLPFLDAWSIRSIGT
jgi:hypothetical protein